MKIERFILVCLFIFSLLVFLAHLSYTKTALYSDTRFYFAYTRSVVKDFDLNFTNEYKNLNAGGPPNSIGIPTNFYPPGVSIFWIPGFFIADLLAKSIDLFIPNLINTSGYGIFYQFFVGSTSIFLGLFGLYLVFLLLKGYFSKKITLLSIATLFLTTNLFFYIAVEPINSHAVSFFVSSLFVYYFLKHAKDKNYYLILGIIGGVTGLVRTQDLLILIFPVIKIFKESLKISPRLITNYRSLITGFILSLLPQVAIWKFFFNTFWYSPYMNYGFNFTNPKIFYVLFNAQNGLFTTTPVVILFIIGSFLFLKRDRKLAFYALLYFLLQLYVVSSWAEYFQGGSFSIRMLINTYPFLSFGLAEVIEKLVDKKGLVTASLILGFASILNMTLIIRYLLLN